MKGAKFWTLFYNQRIFQPELKVTDGRLYDRVEGQLSVKMKYSPRGRLWVVTGRPENSKFDDCLWLLLSNYWRRFYGAFGSLVVTTHHWKFFNSEVVRIR